MTWKSKTVALLAATSLAAYGGLAYSQTRTFDLPAMPANQALPLFAKQAGLQIVAPYDALVGVQTPEIHGAQDVQAALHRLIAGAGLEIVSNSGGVVTLRVKAHASAEHPADQPMASNAGDIAATEMEEIIVKATKPAGTLKRESDTVVDTITALEISRLPNLDLSDALTRLPGVHRNDTQSGENRYVQIRGLDNAAASQSIDGVLLTNYVGSSRATSTEALNAQFIKNIVVTPTVTPDLDENSNSANVALTSVSGLDNGGAHVLDVTGFGGTVNRSGGQHADNTPARGSVLWKGALDADGHIGLAIGLSFDQLGSRQDAVSVAGFNSVNGDFVPNGAMTRGSTFANTQRIAGFARLDAQVTPDLKFFGEYFRFVHQYHTDQYTSSATVTSASAQDVTGTSGQFPTASASYAYNGGELNMYDHILIVGGDYDINPKSHLSFRANATLNATVSTSYGMSGFSAASTPLSQPIRYSATGDDLGFSPGAAASLANPANYLLGGNLTLSDMVTHDQNYFLRTDYTYNSNTNDRGFGFKAGLQYKTLDRHSDQLGNAYKLAPGQSISLSEVSQASSLSMFDPVSINPSELLGLMATRGMPVPSASGLYASDPANGYGQNFDASEQVAVGYLIGSYAADRWRLSAGFRYADTTRHLLDYEPNSAGVWGPQQYNQHYDNLLPSVYGSYNITSKLKLRAAYTETLERPALMSASRNVLASYTTPPTITTSYTSPYLLPTHSRNFDASLDYYYGSHDAYVSVGGFSKYLTDIPGTSTNTVVNPDGSIAITSYKTNLTSVGGKSVYGTDDGIELIWSDPRIVAIPANWGKIGAFVSYDYIMYKTPALNGGNGVPATNLVMVQAAPRDYLNAEVFYNYGPLVANLSYEVQSGVPSYAYASSSDQMTTYYGLLDAQASYAVTSHLRVIVQGRNLTDQNLTTRYLTTDWSKAYQVRNDGRTIWFGAEFTY
jgi:iron complex outermembrane receptor protein